MVNDHYSTLPTAAALFGNSGGDHFPSTNGSTADSSFDFEHDAPIEFVAKGPAQPAAIQPETVAFPEMKNVALPAKRNSPE